MTNIVIYLYFLLSSYNQKLRNFLVEDIRTFLRKNLALDLTFDILPFRIYNHCFSCDRGSYLNNRCNLCSKFFIRDKKISIFQMKHESLIVLCYLQASSNLLIFQGKKYSFFFIIIPSFLGLLMILIMSLKAYIMTILKVFFGCIKNIKKFFVVLYSILYQEIFFPVILSVLDLKNAHD